MRARKLLIIVALIGIGAAACGSSSKTASSSSPTTVASSPGTPTTAGGTQSTGGKSYSGSSNGSFCDAVRNDANTFKGATPDGTSPEDLKALYGNVLPALEKAQSKAPSAIKDDFDTFISAFKQVNAALKAANYDVTKLNASTFTALSSQDFKTASDNIEQYVTQVCHIDTTATT
jgi:hypothetical protein